MCDALCAEMVTALLKNLGLAVSGGHSRIFMEEGVRNTLIQGVRSNQDLNKIKDSNNLVNKTSIRSKLLFLIKEYDCYVK